MWSERCYLWVQFNKRPAKLVQWDPDRTNRQMWANLVLRVSGQTDRCEPIRCSESGDRRTKPDVGKTWLTSHLVWSERCSHYTLLLISSCVSLANHSTSCYLWVNFIMRLASQSQHVLRSLANGRVFHGMASQRKTHFRASRILKLLIEAVSPLKNVSTAQFTLGVNWAMPWRHDMASLRRTCCDWLARCMMKLIIM